MKFRTLTPEEVKALEGGTPIAAPTPQTPSSKFRTLTPEEMEALNSETTWLEDVGANVLQNIRRGGRFIGGQVRGLNQANKYFETALSALNGELDNPRLKVWAEKKLKNPNSQFSKYVENKRNRLEKIKKQESLHELKHGGKDLPVIGRSSAELAADVVTTLPALALGRGTGLLSSMGRIGAGGGAITGTTHQDPSKTPLQQRENVITSTLSGTSAGVGAGIGGIATKRGVPFIAKHVAKNFFPYGLMTYLVHKLYDGKD